MDTLLQGLRDEYGQSRITAYASQSLHPNKKENGEL